MKQIAPSGKHCQISCKVKYIRLSEEESKEREGPDICHRDPRTDDVAEELLIASLVLNRKGRTGAACLSFDQERIRVENPEEGRSAAGRMPISDTTEPGTF